MWFQYLKLISLQTQKWKSNQTVFYKAEQIVKKILYTIGKLVKFYCNLMGFFSLQGLPFGFDLMYLALADRNMQVSGNKNLSGFEKFSGLNDLNRHDNITGLYDLNSLFGL